jgi:hypothetical protein
VGPQRETLTQIANFAVDVARSAKAGKEGERAHALALLFALGVCRGEVHDLLQVRTHSIHL